MWQWPASGVVDLDGPGVDLGNSRVERELDGGRGGSPVVVEAPVGVSVHRRRPRPRRQTELAGILGAGLKRGRAGCTDLGQRRGSGLGREVA